MYLLLVEHIFFNLLYSIINTVHKNNLLLLRYCWWCCDIIYHHNQLLLLRGRRRRKSRINKFYLLSHRVGRT